MTILTDVDTNTGLNDNDAVAALLKTMGKAPIQKIDDGTLPADDDEDEDLDLEDTEEEDGEDGEDADEDEDDDSDDDEASEPETEPKPPAVVEPADDALVKVTVDGVESEVTVASLKRLAGQEASLTKKSQEADVVGGRAALMIQGALDLVMEDLEPYADADWTLLAQEMEPDEFRWHRETFTRNKARFDQLVGQATEFENVVSSRKASQFQAQIVEATAELTKDVPGWNDTLYGEVMAYAVKEGLDKDDVAHIANAKVLKLLLKAMNADKAAEVVTKKVNLAPKRVKRSGGSETLSEGASKAKSNIEKRVLSGRGSDDDAIALLVGRWK